MILIIILILYYPQDYSSFFPLLVDHFLKSSNFVFIFCSEQVCNIIIIVMAIIVNIYFAFSYDPERGSCDADNNDTDCLYFQPIFKPQAPDWYFILKYVVGSIHLILSIWMVIQHILKNWKIFTFKIPSVILLM